jgi:hypothetical protein
VAQIIKRHGCGGFCDSEGSFHCGSGVVIINKVEFFANGQSIGVGSPGGGQYSVGWNSVTQGIYALVAVATDGSGITTTSAPVTVTVGNEQLQCLPFAWLGAVSAEIHTPSLARSECLGKSPSANGYASIPGNRAYLSWLVLPLCDNSSGENYRKAHHGVVPKRQKQA